MLLTDKNVVEGLASLQDVSLLFQVPTYVEGMLLTVSQFYLSIVSRGSGDTWSEVTTDFARRRSSLSNAGRKPAGWSGPRVQTGVRRHARAARAWPRVRPWPLHRAHVAARAARVRGDAEERRC